MGDDSELKDIAIKFRCAIEKAIQAGEFRDSDLENFPNGCCNYISDCLQGYLFEHGIETLCVCVENMVTDGIQNRMFG